MITALKKVAPSWYTPSSEVDEDTPTRFRLQPLTPSQREECMAYSETLWLHIPPSSYGKLLRYGLVDWENLNDETGQPLPCTPANHERLPGDLRMELAMELLMRSKLEGDETKNS